MEILQETDNANNIIISFFLPASSGMVSSSPDVPDVLDVSSDKRITRFHTRVFFAIHSLLNHGYSVFKMLQNFQYNKAIIKQTHAMYLKFKLINPSYPNETMELSLY